MWAVGKAFAGLIFPPATEFINRWMGAVPGNNCAKAAHPRTIIWAVSDSDLGTATPIAAAHCWNVYISVASTARMTPEKAGNESARTIAFEGAVMISLASVLIRRTKISF